MTKIFKVTNFYFFIYQHGEPQYDRQIIKKRGFRIITYNVNINDISKVYVWKKQKKIITAEIDTGRIYIRKVRYYNCIVFNSNNLNDNLTFWNNYSRDDASDYNEYFTVKDLLQKEKYFRQF